MRKSIAAVTAALSLIWLGDLAVAMPETVSGEVIDLACYARNRSTGMHHDRALECAWACVRWEGQPVGLLTADGTIYQLAGGLTAHSNLKIAQYLARTVTVIGEVAEVDGLLTLTSDDVTMVK